MERFIVERFIVERYIVEQFIGIDCSKILTKNTRVKNQEGHFC